MLRCLKKRYIICAALKEELEGSGSRTVEHICLIEEIIGVAEEEKAEYDVILDKADAQELAAMNREYERSVL